MLTVPACKVQQLFFNCLQQWLLANLDDILPDISHIPNVQKELVAMALSEQRAIGWDLCFHGYLSRHWWALAVAACPFVPPTDECPTASLHAGKTWARNSISHLWEFAHEMWIHHNSTLHNSALPDCHQMKGTTVDADITTLYNKVDSYAAEDRWRFDLPLALHLCTPLQSHHRWLILTRVLIDKSNNHDSRGQSKLTTFFQVLSPWRSHPSHQPSSPLPPGTTT
jgi:hypothetical protein